MKQDKNLTAGIVLVNKPKGISSNSVVNIVKAATNSKKAGHLGTLDVAGEGLLPVVLNKATTLFDYFLAKDKVYRTTFQFGLTTDTLDLEGKVTARDDKIVSKEDVLATLPKLIGRYEQMPPAYSAKKVGGKNAYELARSGQEFSLKPKEIEVFSIKLLREVKPNIFEFEIHCSSGTYIRSIVRDMAEKMSTYGVMQCILRTRCGNFDLKDAFTLEQIKKHEFEIIGLDSLFDYPKICLDQTQTDKLLNGQNIKLDCKSGCYRAYFQDSFLGVLEVGESGTKFKFRFV